MNVAIIPARGGSKRIPDKNIRLFAGMPIIFYSIKAAKETGIFDQIIVSTDSEVIAETARRFGATVPFMRPKELSDDHTPTAPVMIHALEFLKSINQPAEYACCVYPTAPFVLPKYICDGYSLLTENQVTSVFSVTTFPFCIFRALRITEAGYVQMFWPEYEIKRSQDLPEAYHDAGQFYWLNCEKFMKTKQIYSPDAMPVIVPRYLVQDIDTPEDWETAERMFKSLSSFDKKA